MKIDFRIAVTEYPPKNRQEKETVTDQTPANTGEILDESPKPGTFKKGYDPRRWLKGQPKKPKDKKKAEELLEHVIWDVLSEEITNPNTGEAIDRLRAMVRSMTTSRQSADKQAILDRIAGKVSQSVDLSNSDGTLKPSEADDTRAEILRKLDSIAAATGADGISKRTE